MTIKEINSGIEISYKRGFSLYINRLEFILARYKRMLRKNPSFSWLKGDVAFSKKLIVKANKLSKKIPKIDKTQFEMLMKISPQLLEKIEVKRGLKFYLKPLVCKVRIQETEYYHPPKEQYKYEDVVILPHFFDGSLFIKYKDRKSFWHPHVMPVRRFNGRETQTICFQECRARKLMGEMKLGAFVYSIWAFLSNFTSYDYGHTKELKRILIKEKKREARNSKNGKRSSRGKRS